MARTSSTDKAQVYGEISLEFRPEIAHGKITGLTTAAAGRWRVRFTGNVYKELVVHGLGGILRNAEAEVTDKATTDALRALPPSSAIRARRASQRRMLDQVIGDLAGRRPSRPPRGA